MVIISNIMHHHDGDTIVMRQSITFRDNILHIGADFVGETEGFNWFELSVSSSNLIRLSIKIIPIL